MSEAISHPRPQPQDDLDDAFWAHCAKGVLCFQRCSDCGTWRHLPRYVCAQCGSSTWEWEASSGRGRIFSWTVTHQAMHPAFAKRVPYATVVVELEEGVRLVSGLHDCPLEELRLDLSVEVVFEKLSDEVSIPLFRKAAA